VAALFCVISRLFFKLSACSTAPDPFQEACLVAWLAFGDPGVATEIRAEQDSASYLPAAVSEAGPAVAAAGCDGEDGPPPPECASKGTQTGVTSEKGH